MNELRNRLRTVRTANKLVQPPLIQPRSQHLFLTQTTSRPLGPTAGLLGGSAESLVIFYDG